MTDVVRTRAEAERLPQPPLVILEPLERLLGDLGIGAGDGPLAASPLGDGHSNVTYLLQRGDTRVVLRRPPRPPYAESAHDVLREARLVEALATAGLRVPRILATSDDREILGVPFVLVEHIDGVVVSERRPAALAGPAQARRIGEELVDALVEIHAADATRPPLADLGRPTGYLERQLRRFAAIWADVATREVPELDEVTAWLGRHRPESAETTVVHGDFRLGNVLLHPTADPARLLAVLDWEMATLGDPLADLGYLTATWAEPGDPDDPMLALSATTREPGFPSRAELAARYADASGRDVSRLAWYEVLGRWKAAIFLEASYARFRSGTTADPYFARLGEGVPRLAAAALERTRAAP